MCLVHHEMLELLAIRTIVFQTCARHAQACQNAGQSDRGRSLNVVVEHTLSLSF